MRVGINAVSLNDRPSGAKQRFTGIYGSLFSLLPDTEFTIFEPSDCNVTRWFPNQRNLRTETTPIPSTGRIAKFAAGLGYWKKVLDKANLEIFEAMHLPMVRCTTGKTLLTIHDIRGVHKSTGLMNSAIFSTVLKQALNHADHVVTVSETMRSEIMDFYPQASVSVIYNGLDASQYDLLNDQDFESFAMKFKLPSEFILAVGHLETRKNYHRLVLAMDILLKRGIDFPLVIIGNDSGEGHDLKEKIVRLGLTNRVKLLSGLSDIEVRCAYKMSNLVVFPSLYEGFGIPILEAMAAKRPMVLSGIPVFQEITQSRCLYFSPDDVESMALAIETGLTSSDVRSQMVAYGESRIFDFSFEKLAQGMADIYKKCQ